MKVSNKPDKPNPTKVSKEPERQSPQILDDTFQNDDHVKVGKGVNPVILFSWLWSCNFLFFFLMWYRFLYSEF